MKRLTIGLIALLAAHLGQAQTLIEHRSIKILERSVEKEESFGAKILVADLTYGIFRKYMGQADIILKTNRSGEILGLEMSGSFSLLGFGETIRQSIGIGRLKQGKPLNFYIKGYRQPKFRITPASTFNSYGGVIYFQFWNGHEYQMEKMILSARMGGYAVYQDGVQNGNRVVGLDINLGGMSLRGIKVRNYHIQLD